MTTAAWPGWAKIDTLLRSAGTNLSAPISDVRRGIPFSVTGRMFRYWYDGTGLSPFAPSNTLGKSQDGLRLTVGIFLPMAGGGSPASEAALDALAEEADAAVQAALYGDFLLNADATAAANGIEIGESVADVLNVQGAAVRYVGIPVTYGIPDAATIAA